MNRPRFIDATIFLQYLTQDQERGKPCLELFKQAERNVISLVTSETVIAEVVGVLSSPADYNLSPQQIQIALSRLLLLPGLKVQNRNVLLRALALFGKEEIAFEDCLTIAQMEQIEVRQVYSYNGAFDSIVGMERVKPAASSQALTGAVQSDQ